jgi:hypothetical protein
MLIDWDIAVFFEPKRSQSWQLDGLVEDVDGSGQSETVDAVLLGS